MSGLFTVLALTLIAQPAPADEAAAVSSAITRQTQRVDQLRERIAKENASIESQIDQIIEMIADVTDSKDSGSRIQFNKEKVVDGLLDTNEQYQRMRDKRADELARGGVYTSPDALKQDIEVLDRRMRKRVMQIDQLTGTFVMKKDLNKYATRIRHDNNDNYRTVQTVNPDYKHNQQVSNRGVHKKKQLGDELDAGIATLEKQNATLEQQLILARTPEQRADIEGMITANKEKIASAQTLSTEQVMPSVNAAPPQVSVGKRDAHDLELAIRDIAGKVEVENRELMRLISEYETERSRLETMRK